MVKFAMITPEITVHMMELYALKKIIAEEENA